MSYSQLLLLKIVVAAALLKQTQAFGRITSLQNGRMASITNKQTALSNSAKDVDPNVG
jgi:hypothetical protein